MLHFFHVPDVINMIFFLFALDSTHEKLIFELSLTYQKIKNYIQSVQGTKHVRICL